MVSPINSRTNAEPLSLDLLKKHVPNVKAGSTAHARLQSGEKISADEEKQLFKIKQAGTRSQEVLIISALPLIKSIASKEFQRRQAWSSRISYDDVLQEAIAGFIRGLLSYNEEAKQTSPTNYLGMWITTSIRRKVESMEHDFAIPYEVVERARKIRAIRSRLISETNTDPTDEELLVALNDVNNYGISKWGKVSPTEVLEPKKGAKQFTQAHLDEAKALAAKAYSLHSYDSPVYGEDEEKQVEKNGTPLTSDSVEDVESYEESNLSTSRLSFFNSAFIRMKMGSKQQDIILRTFGLGYYDAPQTQKEVSLQTGLPTRFIKAVIVSFSQYLPLKGGVFHEIILKTDADVIEGLDFEWLIPLLGEWPDGIKEPLMPPAVLTQSTTKTSQKFLNNPES